MLRSRNGTAVNDILRAGDGGGARRGEKGDEVRHFFRLSRASDQNADRRLIIRKIVPAIRRAGRAPGLISANICFLSWLRIERLNFVPSAIDLEVELGVCAIARKLPTRRPLTV